MEIVPWEKTHAQGVVGNSCGLRISCWREHLSVRVLYLRENLMNVAAIALARKVLCIIYHLLMLPPALLSEGMRALHPSGIPPPAHTRAGWGARAE
jgi:hypothetical protein